MAAMKLAASGTLSRRSLLLRGSALAGAALCPAITSGTPAPLFSEVGITAKLPRAGELREAGADFIVESVADFLIPFASEADFAAAESAARAAPLRIRGCNSFLRDPSLICIGPKADHARVLAYAQTAFSRLSRVGGEFVVFGSSNARQLPAGWGKPRADEQFVALLRGLADLGKRHGIRVCVESLRQQECNYLNHLDEVVPLVAQVDHPNVRVLADLFHMRVMGDTPAQLAQAMPWVGAVELAEREKRTVPGVGGDDFSPFFREIFRGGYRGLIDIEADGTPSQLKGAFEVVRAQAADAMRTAKTS
jgi:sugar phosphate isomerase/epimerase